MTKKIYVPQVQSPEYAPTAQFLGYPEANGDTTTKLIVISGDELDADIEYELSTLPIPANLDYALAAQGHPPSVMLIYKKIYAILCEKILNCFKTHQATLKRLEKHKLDLTNDNTTDKPILVNKLRKIEKRMKATKADLKSLRALLVEMITVFQKDNYY